MILLFVLSALRSGRDRYYFFKTRRTDVKGKEIFHFLRFSEFKGVLLFYVNYYLRKLLYIALCFLPSSVLTAFFFYYIEYGRASFAVSAVLIAFSVVLLVTGIIFFLRFNSLLFVSRYLFAAGAFTSYRRLFADSERCIADKGGAILKQRLKLAGWFISCILVFPVPFVQNYYREKMAFLAEDLIKNQYLQSV